MLGRRDAPTDGSDMTASLRKLWWLLSSREKRNALVLVVLLLINGLLEMAGVGIVPVYVGIVAFPDKLIEHEIVQAVFSKPGEILTQTTLLYWGSALLVLFFSIKLAYVVMLSYWQARFVQNRVLRIGDQLFTAYMQAPYTFHLARNSSQLLRNVNAECARLGMNVLMPLIDALTQIFVMLAVVALLVVASPGLAVLSLMVFTIVAALVAGTLHRKFRELGLEAQAARGNVVKSVREGLGGVKEIKVLQREKLFTNRFRQSLGTTLRIQRFVQIVGKSIPFLMEWISIIGLLTVVLVLFAMDKSTDAIVAIVVLFAVSLSRLKGTISTLVSRYTALQHNLVSLDVVYDDLEELTNAAQKQNRPRVAIVHPPDEGASGGVSDFRRSLELRNVSYRYPGTESDALQEVSLSIQKGEAVGFVGTTGAGKSTLIDVVLGVLSPTSGRILLDGRDIQDDIAAWQRNTGYIPQSIYLIDGSIKENIALGLPANRIDNHAVEQALKAAHLDDFVNELPDGLDTVVGERGVRVSGGQRQRIAIARALYHNPEVLVMDEATSALDNVTERGVIKAVEDLKGERTILMIAHRLTTVLNCDRIVMLEHGRVVAVGTYDQLIRDSEEFRRMAEV